MNPRNSPERPCSGLFIGGAYFIHENRFRNFPVPSADIYILADSVL